MSLSECLADIRRGNYLGRYELAERIEQITSEWERRWANLSPSEKLDAIAYPADPDSVSNMFLRHMERADKRIEELERELDELETYRWISVNEFFPTEDDADEEGRVLVHAINRTNPKQTIVESWSLEYIEDGLGDYIVTDWKRIQKPKAHQ